MKIEEIKNFKNVSPFASRVFEGAFEFSADKKEEFVNGIKDFNNYEELLQFVSEKYPFEQFTAELLKCADNAWMFLRKQLGDKVIKTMSDAGGVRIGNNDFSFIANNGRGDGETRVAIVERDEKRQSVFNKSIPRFNTTAKGHFYIFDYDSDGGKPIVELDGRYGIYYFDGIVILEKWN